MSNPKTSVAQQQRTLSNLGVNGFLLLMLSLFPLFVQMSTDNRFPFFHFDGGFYSIRHVKFYFFLTVLTIALVFTVMVKLIAPAGGKKKASEQPQSAPRREWAGLILFLCASLCMFIASLPGYPEIIRRLPELFTSSGMSDELSSLIFLLVFGISLLVCTIAAAVQLVRLIKRRSNPKLPLYTDTFAAFRPLSFTDFAAVALLLICAVSTIFSAHPLLALLGEYEGVGRNNGLLLILAYLLTYFFITRRFSYSDVPFIGMAIGCGLVYLLTVLNGFYIDPLNMYAEFVNNDQVYNEFLATIGNKNMLSSFICVTLPVVLSMSMYVKKRWARILCLVSATLGGAAVIVCDSDSCLLGMGVFLVVFLIAYLRDFGKLRRFLLGVSCMLLGVVLLRGFSALTNDHYKKLGDETRAILFSNGTLIAFAAVAVLTALVWFINARKPDLRLPKAAPVALASVAGAAVLAALGVMLYFSVIDIETKLGSLEKVLRMNDAWGTHRGIMWLRSFKVFGDASLFQKLFGTGPDTFYHAFQPYFEELMNYGNSSTDAAHNEYLNYLITVGVFGLGAYLAFVGGALKRAFSAARQNPVVLAFAAGVVAYAAQAVLNIAVPISAPLMIIMVSLCENGARADSMEN